MEPQYTIAYVNSDHFAGELMTFSLESAQTQVWAFADAQELLRSIRSADYDCVLAHLSQGERLELECQLHEAGHHLPVIGVTESTDVPALVNALRHGQSLWSAPLPGT